MTVCTIKLKMFPKINEIHAAASAATLWQTKVTWPTVPNINCIYQSKWLLRHGSFLLVTGPCCHQCTSFRHRDDYWCPRISRQADSRWRCARQAVRSGTSGGLPQHQRVPLTRKEDTSIGYYPTVQVLFLLAWVSSSLIAHSLLDSAHCRRMWTRNARPILGRQKSRFNNVWR